MPRGLLNWHFPILNNHGLIGRGLKEVEHVGHSIQYPRITFNADIEEGSILFVKIGILFITAIIIPLFIPRRYVPVDPKNQMPNPNSEQTASIISILTFTFLDNIILMGSKVTHLRADQLPPLADYDGAEYQTTKSFPHLDVFSGAKQRHLFFRLMRVYWKQYSFLAIFLVLQTVAGFVSPIGIYQLLKYLESGGTDQPIKPWVWILWLFCGPMLRSIFRHLYNFISSRVLALTGILVRQLVFEHCLRMRFKAETSNTPESQLVTGIGSTATESVAADTVTLESEETSATESTTRESSSVSEASTVVAHDPSLSSIVSTLKNDTKAKKAAEPPKDIEKQNDANLVGKINNLVTSDLNSIVSAKDFLSLIIGIPLNITLCLVFLYQLLGWSAFVGFAVMVAFLPVPGYVTKIIRTAIVEKSTVTDARIQAVSETMNIIRMVKLFGWEDRMAERLSGTREAELLLVWKIKFLNCFYTIIGAFIIPTSITIATYGFYTAVMKQELTPSTIFSSIAVFSRLSEQLSGVMYQAITMIQGKVSLDRINDFLQKSELLDSFLHEKDCSAQTAVLVSEDVHTSTELGFRNASFVWSLDDEKDNGLATPSSRTFRLRIEGDLLFKRNAINLIIGPTGSGKTSILMALLGEMHFIPTTPDSWFNLPREGGVAYAAQESWVENDTIRNNILFGSEYNDARYKAVIKQCALQADLDLFDAGDATEVGERGLTLSSSWIVDNCLRGDLIKDRTTHNVALVSPVADFVVSIGTDGKIKSQGNQVALAAKQDPELAKELEIDEAATALGEEVIDSDPPQKVGEGKLTVAEEIVEGRVTWHSFKLFLTSLGGNYPILFCVIVIIALLLDYSSHNFQTWYLGFWASQYESHPAPEVPVYLYLAGYCAITLSTCVLYAISYMLAMNGSIRAARTINAKLIDSILHSTLRWLDETPVARIIARCTQDIRTIDSPLPLTLLWTVDGVAGVLTKLGAIILFTPIFLWPGLVIGVLAVLLGNIYLKAQLSVQRETSNARAPMLAHFSGAVHGLVSIRAYGAQDRFKNELYTRLDHFTRLSRISNNLNLWIAVRMDFLGAGFTAALATYLVYGPPVGASNTGFSLNMALDFTASILSVVRVYNDLEVQANSLERIQGYIDIEHEPKPTEEGKPPASWPTSGDLRVESLSARYSRTGPRVLHDLSFHIASGERVGVVGRTGSGKSSLTLSLLRCILTEGEVYLDGVPTSSVNLDALRTSITIIPQMPELLSGTLRENLDPFDQNDDAVLNDALDAAGLFALQEDAGEASLSLDTKISSAGGNLSVGQRQIIALARAMIRGSKLLMLDEATSAIDYKTDAIIQRTLRTQLAKDVTVVTVAHRLQTIMDSDKIMVLDNGRIAEFGKPADLLQNEKGMLRALVNESTDKEKLHELAGAH
ncbi:hypothetical protein HYPSUDRAFT_204055 [Hypholoma sublateritium FD-334 SS-4]|uniref:P-loop containing nucleoside triphosphate hydrolase protein n=1 Tax=Hypholoma sublateritium (strain FD-334 SS-4) TaxID=945553 RepID=A0A0D2MA26_HYPSF|nr:hypothetical protein HYPSUDRAFT_204055 [Hypholoma sublateritium FD-334 SS-4]